MTLPEPNTPAVEEESGGAPMALKLLVYGLGVMLFLAMFLFAGGIYWKFGRGEVAEVEPAPASVPAAVSNAAVSFNTFGARELPLPEGARILETTVDGSTLVLRFEADQPDGARVEMLWIYDMAQNRVIGSYTLPTGR